MNVGNVLDDYKKEIHRLRVERDVLRETLIDQIQWNNNITRERATEIVDMKMFHALNGWAA